MFRIIFGLIAALLMLSALRAVITSFSSILSAVFSPSSSRPSGPIMPRQGQTPVAQVLRRCASCGTFSPESTARKVGKSGAEVYFCSQECQAKGVAKAS